MRRALWAGGRAGFHLTTFIWNAAQAAVIAEAPDARLIVDAGPGTGKTATAAGRIASLAKAGLPPQSLWTISFSRAAVGEMRARLSLLGGAGRVTTLDSLAWYLREEGEDDFMVLEGHDRAIEETLLALRGRDPAMLKRIAAIAHFTIDEAQDLVGARALLVVELLAALPLRCGVTILTDEAQAIYGFSATALTTNFAADTVARHLLDEEGSQYRLHRLTEIHRTGDAKLLRLFHGARAHAMQDLPNPARKLKRMRRTVAFRAHGKTAAPDENTLILYRSRAEVLAAAQSRIESSLPYRLRLSGLPVMLQPWIATVLGDYESSTLPRWQFEDLWAARFGTGEVPFDMLAQITGSDGPIAMPRLLKILCTSHPPSELCRFDPGDPAGPVIGTIHASKGREAQRVQLMLPQGKAGRDDPDAEARVLFVGATRAKTHLEIGKGLRLDAKRLANGRVYIPTGATSVRIEMGRPGDFIWRDGCDLAGLQPGQVLGLICDHGALQILHAGLVLGDASASLLSDLRDIRAGLSGGANYRPLTLAAKFIAFLGLYTVAHEPKLPRATGLALAPAVSGLVKCDFGSEI